jgi:ParB-like chromosome segregation protein Spo0J
MLTAEIVPIDSVRPYEKNARKGDIATIAESLMVHGQYRPILVNSATSEILAGSHTWMAAKSLEWSKISVVSINVDVDTAKRIVVADNRTSDLASYDTTLLLEVLKALPDLEGTGFDSTAIDELEGVFDDAPTQSTGATPKPPSEWERVRIGYFKWLVDSDAFDAWRTHILGACGDVKSAAARKLRVDLGIPMDESKAKAKITAPFKTLVDEIDVVDIESLSPWPENAREGDVGSLCESLMAFGQFRPIVVRRSDRLILVGNHTWQAARAIGWDTIAVTWVDCSNDDAAKIVLVDNRSSDLASYDDGALRDLVSGMSTLSGTGFAPEDVDDLLRGGSGRYSGQRTVGVQFGDIRFTVGKGIFDAWANGLPESSPERYLAGVVGLPIDACEFPTGDGSGGI